MRCLRCGYCCKKLSVVIVDNPDLGVVESNLIFHDGLTTPCQHLRGDTPGAYACVIHDKDWYADTPCGTHNSEILNDRDCRLGRSIIDAHLKKQAEEEKK